VEFFDEKEDVLEMIVTPYGRHLLSTGQFNPEFYAFFDDDILYDFAWVTGSTGTETQNGIEGRIQHQTPRMRQPTAFIGIETAVNQNNELIMDALDYEGYGLQDDNRTVAQDRPGHPIYNQPALQRFGDQFDFLSSPLGTSEISSKYLPTWKVQMLDGQISSSQGNYPIAASGGSEDKNTTGSIRQIPQLNITLNYQVYVDVLDPASVLYNAAAEVNYAQTIFETPSAVNVLGGNPDEAQGAWQPYDDVLAEEFEMIGSTIFPDNTYFTLKDGKVVLSIEENNTLYKKENFDIQVFLSSSAGLELLNFANSDAASYKTTEVEKYLSLRADREIEAHTLKKIGAPGLIAPTRNYDGKTVPRDGNTTNVLSTREFLIRDLYEPDPEICD